MLFNKNRKLVNFYLNCQLFDENLKILILQRKWTLGQPKIPVSLKPEIFLTLISLESDCKDFTGDRKLRFCMKSAVSETWLKSVLGIVPKSSQGWLTKWQFPNWQIPKG